MKRLILLFLVLMVMSVPALGGDKYKTCAQVDKLTETIMRSRQSGLSIAEMMDVLIKSGSFDRESPAFELVSLMIEDAFEFPEYSTKQYQERAVVRFRNRWYKFCVDTLE